VRGATTRVLLHSMLFREIIEQRNCPLSTVKLTIIVERGSLMLNCVSTAKFWERFRLVSLLHKLKKRETFWAVPCVTQNRGSIERIGLVMLEGGKGGVQIQYFTTWAWEDCCCRVNIDKNTKNENESNGNL